MAASTFRGTPQDLRLRDEVTVATSAVVAPHSASSRLLGCPGALATVQPAASQRFADSQASGAVRRSCRDPAAGDGVSDPGGLGTEPAPTEWWLPAETTETDDEGVHHG